jgi:hypothetical protein
LRAAHRQWDDRLATLPATDRVEVARAGSRLLLSALTDLEKVTRAKRPVPSGA